MFPKQIHLNNRGISITLGLLSPFLIGTGFTLMHTASLTRIPQVDMEILDNQPGDDGSQYKAVQTQFNKELYPGWEQRLGLGFTLSLLGLASGLVAYQLSPFGDGKFRSTFTLCTIDSVSDSNTRVPKSSRPSSTTNLNSFVIPPTVIEQKEESAESANPFPVEELDRAFVRNPVVAIKSSNHTLDLDLDDDESDYNIAEDLGKYLQTSLIVGVPGAGKGIMFSNAIRYARQYHPDLIIMGIDPKNDPKEDGYWQDGFSKKRDGSPLVFRTRIDAMTNDGATEWICRHIKTFQSLPSPKLLVLDEVTIANAMMSKSTKDMRSEMYEGQYQTFLKSMASSGDSREEFLWMVSQTAHLKELGFAGDQRSLFRAIALISTKNIANARALLGTSFIPKTTIEKILPYIEQSEIKRAIYDGKTNKWYPAIALPNYSSYDRDSRSYLDDSEDDEIDEDALIESIVMSA